MRNACRSSRFLARERRGNTLILTAGILVLLVIIASAYISRTQAGRATARAMRDAEVRTTSARSTADALARELADALFVWGVDTEREFLWTLPPDATFLSRNPARSSVPRIAPPPDAVRWGVDWVDTFDNQSGFGAADGVPDHPYNFAPYQVHPWTNWPDNPTGTAVLRPWPSNPRGTSSWTIDPWEGNPHGNPGFGDTRWLADLEPMRWNADGDPEGLIDSFKYWRHLTNISRPNNQWRICRDISDITDADQDGVGGLVTNGGHADPRQDLDQLRAPVEQWLASVQPANWHFAANGDTNFWTAWYDDLDGNGHTDFIDRWQDWLLIGETSSTVHGYPFVYNRPELIPPNFYHLKDLDAGGDYLNPYDGERPSDEFVGYYDETALPDGSVQSWPLGTPRWNIGRVLADADGDGFTDSFWFFDPAVVSPGVRRIVAVRIVDNGAMINANVATRFHPGSTMGETPADVALVGQRRDFNDWLEPVPDNWNVGFFDTFLNREAFAPYPLGPFPPDGALYRPGAFDVRWEAALWPDFLALVGVGNRADLRFDDLLLDPFERRDYWLNQGSLPLQGFAGLQPFGLADELELRMYHGQNYPWIYSRFERAVNFENDTAALPHAFLRSSSQSFQETTPYLDQLNNPELMHDRRRMITLYNGARNDLVPPWLRWRWRDNPLTPENERYPAGLFTTWGNLNDVRNFESQARTRLDLREPLPEFPIALPDTRQGYFHLHERMPWVLAHVLADGDADGSLNRPVGLPAGPGFEGRSLFGEYAGDGTGMPTAEQDEVRRMAAAFTANVLAVRDTDDDAPVAHTIAAATYTGLRNQLGATPLPEWGNLPEDPETQYLGLERQPFISEVFIGHFYGSTLIPPGGPVEPMGERIVDQSSPQTTVVVVQIVNPFQYEFGHPLYNVGIDLSRYKLRVAGQDVELSGFLLPANEEKPTSAIFYAIETDFDGDNTFGARTRDFLDILPVDLEPDSLVWDTALLPGSWSTSRNTYDSFGGEYPVELIRFDPAGTLPEHEIVVDRIDQDFETSQQFGVRLTNLDLPPVPGVGDISGQLWANGIQIGNDAHWSQWVRVARPWGDDRASFDIANPGTHGIQFDQSGPRFVNAKQFVTFSDESQNALEMGNPVGPYRGSTFSIVDPPDGAPGTAPWFDRALNSVPWQDYLTSIASTEPLRRKPTFFNQNVVFDMAGFDVYPVYLDPTYGYGLYLYGMQYAAGTAPGMGIPDKGVYHRQQRMPFDHKDGDFQAIGELFHMFVFGHELSMLESPPGSGTYIYQETERTFAEHLLEFEGEPLQGNRLVGGEVIGLPLDAVTDMNLLRRDATNFQPAMRAGHRIYEAFVCDGSGVNSVPGTNDFYNAAGFSGELTPGLINIATAPIEVMRALPNWTKPVHHTLAELTDPGTGPGLIAQLERSAMAEAVVTYRERLNGNPDPVDPMYGSTFGVPNGPDYSVDRASGSVEIRDVRGLASMGELRETRKEASQPWDPYGGTFGEEMRLDTDAWTFNQDDIDSLVRVSNLVTTTSDVFTVYFKVRSFTQREDGFWDATDPENIIDDARYVMIVDRSNVNSPTDSPRILHVEKLPN